MIFIFFHKTLSCKFFHVKTLLGHTLESNNELKIAAEIYQFDRLNSIIFDSTNAILPKQY